VYRARSKSYAILLKNIGTMMCLAAVLMCFIAGILCVMVSTMGDNGANGMRNVCYDTHVSQNEWHLPVDTFRREI